MADMTNTQAEHEVEQQMYQAMAAQMQSEGMDVTAEEIAQTVEEQTSDHPPEPSAGESDRRQRMLGKGGPQKSGWQLYRRGGKRNRHRNALYPGHYRSVG